MLDQGFEPWSSARKAKMIGRTTPIERCISAEGVRTYKSHQSPVLCVALSDRGSTGDCRRLLAGKLGVVVVHKGTQPLLEVVGSHQEAEGLSLDLQSGIGVVPASEHRSLGELLGDRWPRSQFLPEFHRRLVET